MEDRREDPFIHQARSMLLCDKPAFLPCKSYTTGLAPAVLTYMISTEVKSRFGGHVVADEIGLPVTETGLVPSLRCRRKMAEITTDRSRQIHFADKLKAEYEIQQTSL